MKAIILAAGYATRLYPLTLDRPKPLLPVKGKPMIDYIVEQINTVDAVDAIYVVTNSKFYGHFAEWAETAPGKIPPKVLDDGTATEETRLGAIGDIYFTIEEEKIDDELMVIAGDNYFTFQLADYYDFYKRTGKDCVCAKELDNMEQLKAFAFATADENGKITELVEKPEQPKSNLAVYATYMYRKETVPMFREYLEQGNKPDAPGYFVQWLYKRKDVYAYKMQGECYDIGTPQAYEDVNRQP